MAAPRWLVYIVAVSAVTLFASAGELWPEPHYVVRPAELCVVSDEQRWSLHALA